MVINVSLVYSFFYYIQSELPIQTKLRDDIQEVYSKLEEKEEKLSELSSSLEKEREKKADISRDLEVARGILSRRRNEVGELRQLRRADMEVFESKQEELNTLKLFLEKQTKENTTRKDIEKVKALIQIKEEEICELHASLEKKDGEIGSSSQVIENQREMIEQVSTELAVKVSNVQDLERSRKELRDELERERKRVDHLVMQTTVTGGVNAFHKEIQVSSGIHEWYIAVQ